MDLTGTITRIIATGGSRAITTGRRRAQTLGALLRRHDDLRPQAVAGDAVPLGPADEEDVAARAFTKVCRGIKRPLKLASRLDFTKVLRSATGSRGIRPPRQSQGRRRPLR